MPQLKPNWTEAPPRDWSEEQAYRIAQEVRRLRRRRSAQWLADKTGELGYHVTRTVISDLENGRRRYVTTAELIVLARALNTAPIALMYPFPYYQEGKIQILPIPEGKQGRDLDKIVAVQWFTGEFGLYLNELGMPLVDQQNYYSQLRGLERARKVFDLGVRKQKWSVQLAARRRAKLDGDGSVTDEEIDELVSEIDDLDRRIDDLLTLGDRDLQMEAFERFQREHVSRPEKQEP